MRPGRGRDGRLAIEIRDSGSGIDPAFLPNLFQLFSQEDSGHTRRFEGAGVGLALAKRLLDLCGAELRVDSVKGAGTTMTVRFDRAVELRAREERDAAPGAPGAILVVEDDPASQELVRRILGPDRRIVCAGDVAEARRLLDRERGAIRVVLMDVSLLQPSDGLALTRALRNDPRYRGLRIIAVTAYASPDDRRECLEAGCDAYLAKPFKPADLIALVDEAPSPPPSRC